MRTALLALSTLATSASIAACGSAQSTEVVEYADAMLEEHAGEQPTATPTATTAGADVGTTTTSDATYHADASGDVIGFHAHPTGGAEVGVVLIHEWWGLNDNIRGVAERLAGHGYTTLAVDTYGGASAQSADEARSLMMAALDDPAALVANTAAAAHWLRREAGADRVVVMGYCYGGGLSLNTAIDAANAIDGAIIYYGHVTDDADRLSQIEDPVVGFFGGLDQGIPVEGVRAFEAALDGVGADATIHVFDDADHAFANPSGQRYQAEAAEAAWDLTLTFLDEIARGER